MRTSILVYDTVKLVTPVTKALRKDRIMGEKIVRDGYASEQDKVRRIKYFREVDHWDSIGDQFGMETGGKV